MSTASHSKELYSVSGKTAELRVMAEFDQLPVVRAVAETLAILGDFNLDEVADIKLALDEICSQLMTGAAEGTYLRCVFIVGGAELHAAVTAQVVDGYEFRRDGFSWHVLEAVVDGITVRGPELNPTGPHREVAVQIVKLRVRA